MAKPTSAAEFVRQYAIDVSLSPGARLADMLNKAAEQLPKIYFSRRLATQIAFALHRLPREDNENLKRLGGAIKSANRILEREHKRAIESDPVEGLRATTTSNDLVETVHRKARRRVVSAGKRFEEVDALVDDKKLSPAHRDEVDQVRRAFKRISSGLASLPQLPPVKPES